MTARMLPEAATLVDTMAAQDDPPAPKALRVAHRGAPSPEWGTWVHMRMGYNRESKSNPPLDGIGGWLAARAREALERRPMMRRLGKT
jgi:hypothetical protein